MFAGPKKSGHHELTSACDGSGALFGQLYYMHRSNSGVI